MKLKNLVFLNSVKDYNHFIKNHSKKDSIFILCNFSEEAKFKNKNIIHILLDEFLDFSQLKNYDKDIFDFSHNLFSRFPSLTTYKGINLGDIVAYDLKFIFSEILFYHKQIKPIIKEYAPERVYIYNNPKVSDYSFFRFFKKDPVVEVLSSMRKQYNFKLVEFHSLFSPSRIFRNIALHGLRISQKIVYSLNPYKDKKDAIIMCGSLNNIKSLINSSPLSKNYSFHNLLNLDGKEFNFSKNFFFINPTPLFVPKSYNSFFREKYSELTNNEQFKSEFKFYNEDLFQLFKKRLKIIFNKLLPLMAYYQDYIINSLDKLKPKAICLMEDVESFSRLLTILANKQGIPTFVMQYGLYSLKNPSAFWPSSSKCKFLWGEADKELFVKLGVSKDNIFVVGAPRFKNYADKVKEKAEEIKAKLNIQNDKKIILFTSQYVSAYNNRYYSPGYHLSRKEYEQSIKILIETFESRKDFHLVLSLRPGSDDISFVKSIIKGDNITIVDAKELFTDILNASEALITFWSTTGLEAMLLNKLLLTFKLESREDIVDFLKYKAAYGFKTRKQLEQLIDNLTVLRTKEYSKNQTNYVKAHLLGKGNSFEILNRIISSGEDKTSSRNF